VAVSLNLREVVDGIFELRLDIPWEEGQVNCFLLADGAAVDMVDCGMNSESSLELVRAAIREVGGPSGRLRTLLVTHIHPDHYGAAGELTGRGGVDLLLHRLEVPLVHPRYLEIEQLVEEVGRYLRVHGVPPAEAAEMKNASRAIRDVVTPAAPTLQLDGSETIRLGRSDMRVEWTPGHSPGHICLFERGRALLLSGDQLLPELSPNVGLHPQSTPDPLDDYVAGLARLERLSADIVLPAHGRPFRGVAERVTELVEHHERRKRQIVDIVGRDELTAWDVAVAVWGHRAELHHMRLALQEGLAHLQSLSVHGRLRKLARPGAITWRAPA
jgi:glyoxylase-like metal-dependent hydrolase (beta-lactamase superfamily II)